MRKEDRLIMIKNTPKIVDYMLDETVTVDSRIKLRKRLEEVCNLATQALEQEPFINKPCISAGVCEHDKQKMLDKIRAEIESLTYYWCEVNPRTVIDEVLDIIDKYEAESEE